MTISSTCVIFKISKAIIILFKRGMSCETKMTKIDTIMFLKVYSSCLYYLIN